MNAFLILQMLDQRHKNDRFIKYNFSSTLSLLFNTLNNLDEHLKDYNSSTGGNNLQLKETIIEVREQIFYINNAIYKTKLLNNYYDVNLFELEIFFSKLTSTYGYGNNPTADQIETLREIIEITKKYEIKQIGRIGLYDDKSYFPKKMLLPEETQAFFTEICEVLNKDAKN